MALGEAAAWLTVDEAAYVIGSTYAAMLPPEYRSEHGVFYTPPHVVARLLDAASAAGVDWRKCTVLDPACGGGAFLAPVAARMIDAMTGCDRRVILRNIASRLRGYELDAFAAWMSQVFLEAVLHTKLDGAGSSIFDAIEVGDALGKHAATPNFDLVVGNPPYGRVSLKSDQRDIFKRSLYGHANLYGIFLDFAIRRARADGGVIAYVTPTSFLSGEYFKRLRALLVDEARPLTLDFVEERSGVFDDVLQETLLAVYRRGACASGPAVHFFDGRGSSVAPTSACEVTLPVDVEGPWILPRSPSSIALAAQLRAFTHRLCDWGYGVSTGPLVWNRYKDRLRARAERHAVPLIWAEAVSSEGTFSFRAARRNHAPYFAVKDHEADGWLLVEKPCVLLQRTTSKEQARRLVAAELPATFLTEHGAVTVENHLNMIVPVVPSPKVNTAALAAFLNSAAADRAFRCISGSVAVSAYELESMPLPAPDSLRALEKLLQRTPARRDIERFCDDLYRGA